MKKLILVILAVILMGCESNPCDPVEEPKDTHVGKVTSCFILTVNTQFGSETFYSLHTWTDTEARLMFILNTDSSIVNVSLDELKDYDIKVGNY